MRCSVAYGELAVYAILSHSKPINSTNIYGLSENHLLAPALMGFPVEGFQLEYVVFYVGFASSID